MPPINATTLAAYRMHRARGKTAVNALAAARADIERGQTGFARYEACFARQKDGTVWFWKPQAYGLREVGEVEADTPRGDVWARGGTRNGWYCEDGSAARGLMRGVVYQLPARGGKVRFVPGYLNTDQDGVTLDFSRIMEDVAERAYYGFPAKDYEAARDAARRADHMASKAAEAERDYNRAWRAGAEYADRLDTIDTEREAVRALLAERRRVKGDGAAYPAICKAISEQVSASLEAIATARKERDALKAGEYEDGHYYLGFYTHDKDLRAAFNDGAGFEVL